MPDQRAPAACSRPGVISAHIFGLAADISVVGETSIMGNSRPGGITEKAVRNILLLPAEMSRQVISLLGLGGPSFPLSNHDDHIHVGFSLRIDWPVQTDAGAQPPRPDGRHCKRCLSNVGL